ncbi:hypothetical protein VKT23_013773 [Stygiomarasmius scandens]|uniref:Uncharacterized protein n=1 Tax=Marasmiellus scandens TaxID=2682957 RepID=A0ABR1J300_9AGAR
MPHIPTLPTTSRIPDYNTLIFDLGDVIFTYALDSSTQRPSSISPKVLRATLSSKLWGDYEKGLVDEENCYIQASSAVQVNPDDLRMALEEARSSLVFTPEMISLLRELQSRGIKLYAMSNISHPDFQYLSSKFDLTIFERVYTSCEAHERKPELSFYRRVLEDIGEDPKRIIFVDDKVENVLSASSFGIHGIVFDNPKTLRRDLLNLLEDPVSRAKEYLKLHQGQLDTVTETGVSFKDNFSQLLIYEWTGDW